MAVDNRRLEVAVAELEVTEAAVADLERVTTTSTLLRAPNKGVTEPRTIDMEPILTEVIS